MDGIAYLVHIVEIEKSTTFMKQEREIRDKEKFFDILKSIEYFKIYPTFFNFFLIPLI